MLNFKKKLSLYFNIVTYISGTFILMTLIVIMTINFLRDARIFAKDTGNSIQTGESTESRNDSGNNENGNGDDQPIIYNPGFELVDSPNESEPGTQEIEESAVRIEVVDYTGVDLYSDMVILSLRAFGYLPERKNEEISGSQETVIIDRSGKGYGEKIKNILKLDNLVIEEDPDREYDITVIIGNDFMPPP